SLESNELYPIFCHFLPERLHWPEMEMSKSCVLSPMEKPVSPSQLHLERISSGVLKDLFNTATSSYNTLLQKESDAQESTKHSSNKCPKRVSTARHRDRPLPTLAPLTMSGLAFGCRDSRHSQSVFSCFSTSSSKQTNSITMLGSAIRLSPGPIPRPKNSCPAGTKLPQLSRVLPAARDVENSIKKLCILTAIKPSNVEKEKARFFKADFKYNPQFEYSNPLPPQVLAKHSTASDRFLTQVSAVRIMELALQKYGSYEKFEQATGGNLLTKSRIWYHVKKYMEKEGCMGEIVVNLTDDLLSRASMTVVNSRPTLTINISTAREQWLEGMLRHEIGACLSISTSDSPLTKRGQTDTALPGCFSKDQVYLDGILKILRHRDKIDFQLLMALGKVSYEDVERLKSLALMEHVRIPHFLQDQARYTEQLHKIMEVNQLTDEELCILI
uniref:Si:dkey-222b8.4 n=1 Tax=Sinocyclocheilus rhinocerous TaxID=307959 RepID=A0A673KQX0_9TELE